MLRPIAAAALTAALALAACDRSAEPAAADPTAGVATLVNEARARHGEAALRRDARLAAAADAHAADMARHAALSHTGSDGSSPGERVYAQGYFSCLTAENIARQPDTPAALIAQWMNSPDHRVNILRPGLRHHGIARAGDHWVLVMARPC